MKRYVLVLFLVGACDESVDPAGLPSIVDYRTWYSITTSTDVPGHGNTVRDIFVNPLGRTYPHGGRYPIGTVLVKDIYVKNDDGSRGAYRYTAIMRKVGEDAAVDAEVYGGWVWTTTSKFGGCETSREGCFSTCHKQGPWDSAWLDYGE